MSKLIVEMEMPQACPCDLIGVGYDLYCSGVCGIPERVKEYYECVENGTRPDWCPIKGVLPETHGRLIDEAVFCENVVKYSHQSTKTIGKALDATPTIIEMTPIVTERKDDENH